MKSIQSIDNRHPEIIDQMLDLWTLSVMKTHAFLSRSDIIAIRPDAKNGFLTIEHLYGFFDDQHTLQGFIGVQNNKIEMLFVAADAFRQGIGKQLLHFALHQLGAKYVDVNEQNIQAFEFYKQLGFVQIGRSELDEQGRAFPILHLQLND